MASFKTIEEKVWEVPKALIETTLKAQNVHGLIIHGEAGLGKTYLTRKTLVEEGLKENSDFIVRESRGTPLGVYIMLFENPDATFVLDDMMAFWSDETVRGILMSALWDKGNGKRYISWTTSKVIRNGADEIPTRFEFRGKIIFIANDIPDVTVSPEYEPFFSRCYEAELKLNFADKVSYFKEIAQKRNVPKEVMDYVLGNVDDTFTTFNFRTILKVMEIFKSEPKVWKHISKSLLKCDEELKLMKELVTSRLPVEQQAEKFWQITGKSRATYFRMKNKYAERWLK